MALRLFSSTAAFTLVEITLIVGILVVLSAIVLVTLNIRGNSAAANNVKRKIDLEQIQKALDLRAQETGDSLPTGLSSGLSERCVGTGSDAYNLSNISWTESSGDPDIKFDVRSCDDASCVGETWPGTPAFSSSPAILNITNAPYFQYKATYNVTETPWDQTTNDHFNAGSRSGIIVNNNSILLRLTELTDNNVPTLDLSLGSATGGCNGAGLSWAPPICTIPGGTYEFSSINIPNFTTLKVTGDTKLTLKSQGSVTVAGVINLYGAVGTASGVGADANNGGGGDGGRHACSGQGVGPFGVGGGSAQCGGGFGGIGGWGAGCGGVAYPDPYNIDSDIFYGGSGGGGGAGNGACGVGSSNGGGAGAGAIRVISNNSINIASTGIINAYGGNGGPVAKHGPGGGAGGSVLLQARNGVINSSSIGGIKAYGGIGTNGGGVTYWSGSGGAGGRVRMETLSGSNITAGVVSVVGGAGGTGTGTAGAGGTGGNGTSNSGATVGTNAIIGLSNGIYTSAVKDTGQASDFTTVSWTSTIPSSATNMTIEMQSANLIAGTDCATGTVDWAGGSGWQSVATIGTANANSSANIPSTLDGKRCVQYRATLNTSNTAQTPSLDSITIKYFPGASKPVLNDVIITTTSSLLGDSRVFTNTTYNDFLFGSINPSGTLAITGLASPNDAAQGTIEYSTGSPPMTYTSPVFSGSCYNLTTDLAPLYLGLIPKDPKIGTDENTGYLISVDSATKVVCVKAPGAENDEVIENCRK